MTTLALADEKSGVLKCPACENSLERISRTAFMRVLIGSKRYYCWHCHQEYLYFLRNYFSLRP